MTGLGELLRQAREKQGLSIEDVSKRLYIRASYLEALESEDFTKIPGTVYAKGFLRNYGELLGLNEAGLVDRWMAMYGDDKNPIVTVAARLADRRYLVSDERVEPMARPRRRVKRRRKQNRREQLVWLLIAVLMAFIVIIVFWW